MMSKRIYTVDILRSLAIINMIIYHTLYDLKYVFKLDIPYFSTQSWYYYQQYICISFIFLAGFSSNFSKNLFKNALKLTLVAIIISIVTHFLSDDLTIRFGVIHLLGFSMLAVHKFNSLYNSDNKSVHLLLFILSMLSFIYLKVIFVSTSFYKTIYPFMSNIILSFALGFPRADFYSADYFPILPWFILFISGYFAGKYYKMSDSLQRLDNIIAKQLAVYIEPLAYIGRHSLIIYLLHQVIIYGLLCVIIEFTIS